MERACPHVLSGPEPLLNNRLYVIYNDPIPPVQVSVRLPIHSALCEPWTSSHGVCESNSRFSSSSFAPVQIEVVPAGEEGPRNLDASTVMAIKNVPFLTVTEFVRVKLKVWVR